MAYTVGIVGAAGYAGVELARILLGHPDFELRAITSNADAGQALGSVYPAFAAVEGAGDLVFSTHDDPVLTTCDLRCSSPFPIRLRSPRHRASGRARCDGD